MNSIDLGHTENEWGSKKKKRSVIIAYDILEKQHVGFDIGDLGFLEFAGPKGPNLSPIQKTGRQKDYYGRAEYKKDIPGFSMKLTKKFQ